MSRTFEKVIRGEENTISCLSNNQSTTKIIRKIMIILVNYFVLIPLMNFAPF